MGGGYDSTSLSLERDTRIRDARLVMQADTVETPIAYRLNATTWGAGEAAAWSGSLPYGIPDQPVATYEAIAFNATRVDNVSSLDGTLEKSPTAANFSYELYSFHVLALDLVELKVMWSGYCLPPAMPINWNGKMFAFNYTDLEWDEVATYPFPLTGVQDVWFNATSPANYNEPGTRRVSIMIASESTATEVFTDFIEVTAVSGVFPRPSVDVGGEGGIDWRWDAPGWGAIGRQDEFEGGSTAEFASFPNGGGTENASFLLPDGLTVTSGVLTLRSLPESNSTNRSGGPLVVPPGSTTNITVGGLPSNALGDAALVRFSTVTSLNLPTDANRVNRTGVIQTGSDPNGYRAASQTFNVTQTAALGSIAVFVFRVQGNPGPLEMRLHGVNGTGVPTGPPIATSQVPQGGLANDSWVAFGFDGPTLTQGTLLAFVVVAPGAPPDTTSNYVTLGASTSENFTDGEALSYFNVTGLGETWSRPAGTDLLFDIGQNFPTTSGEAANIRLGTANPNFSQFAGVSNVSFAVTEPAIEGGSSSFSITNNNTMAVRFNWSIHLDFVQVAQHLNFTLLNSSASSLLFNNLTAGIELNIGAQLQSLMDSGDAPAAPTGGIPFRRVTLSIEGDGAGLVQFAALDVRYDLAVTTFDLSPSIDATLRLAPPTAPRADIPIRVYSPGASTLTILEAAITYDRPPVYFGFPSTVLDEDTPLLTDLNTVFHDDWDNAALSFYVNQTSGFQNATFSVSGYNLTITPLANRSGTVVLTVDAQDSMGLSNNSGPVAFTIRPFNDPPRLTIDRIDVGWGRVSEVDLTPYIEDAEFPALAVTITSASGTAVTINDRSLLFDFQIGAPDVDVFVTLSDGSLDATYTLRVHPRQANTPPFLLPIPTLVIPNNAARWLDLTPYGRDGEDSFAQLNFSLTVPPANLSDLFWSIDRQGAVTFLKLIPSPGAVGPITTQLVIIDTDGNSNSTTLGLVLSPPADTPPRIVNIDPTLTLGADPQSIFLATKYADLEDANDPSRVTWIVTNDNPGLFTAEIDPQTQRLLVTPVPGASGTGTFDLTLRDSGGLETTRTFTVSVPTAYRGSSASIVAVGLAFAATVVFAAFAIRRARDRGVDHVERHMDSMKSQHADGVPLIVNEAADDSDMMEMPSAQRKRSEDVGSFLRGLTESPEDAPPSDDEGVVSLGLKSGLEGGSAPIAAPVAPAEPGAKAAARLSELYLFSLKDGTLLSEVPAQGLPAMSQADESEFLQWAFDTVRREERTADIVKVFPWKDDQVLIARGEAFFIAGRTRGEDFDALKRSVRTLVEEVDGNFPGSTADWQRTDIVDTVADILRRLVR